MTNEIQFLLYNMLNAEGKMQVIIKDDTPWYTERAMGQIFGVDIPVICKHLNDIFDEGELDAYSVVSKMETTAADGQKQEATFYSLDAVIAVGYRVSSLKATRFLVYPPLRSAYLGAISSNNLATRSTSFVFFFFPACAVGTSFTG